MNQSAERHVAKGADYIAKGDGFYRKAGEEFLAAREADPTLSFRAIGERIGKSDYWVRKVTDFAAGASDTISPFSGIEETGKPALRNARQVLREAPMEQVEKIISELPASRQRQIGAAAGDAYTTRVNEIADRTRRPVTEGVSGTFGAPSIVFEERSLLEKLAEVKKYLEAHGDEMIPDPDGGPAESIRDLTLGSLAASKGKLDLAFAELGIGTSIEEGFRDLLSGSERG